jgi:excisionase family DNA binding protein
VPRITDFDDLPHEYLTVPDFAAYLMVGDKLVRKWIRSGVLQAYRFPPGPTGEVRIAKTDAIAFVKRSRFGA